MENETGDRHPVGSGVHGGDFETVDHERTRLDADVVDPPFSQCCHRGEI
jgi:hypothetical protein